MKFPREALNTKRGKHTVAQFVEFLTEEAVASQHGSDAPVRYFHELDDRIRDGLDGFIDGLDLLSVDGFEEAELHEASDTDYQRAAGL